VTPPDAVKQARIAELKRWIEEVMRLAGPDSLLEPEEGEAIVVDKDHAGQPGAVVIKAHHKSGLIQHWKRKAKRWVVAKTEQPN
jgi:hypothetical protein